MRSKKSEKKLTLNKATVADLNKDEMKAVLGGGDTSCEGTCSMTICISDDIPLRSLYISC